MELTLLIQVTPSITTNNLSCIRCPHLVVLNQVVLRSTLQVPSFQISPIHKTSIVDLHQPREIFLLNIFQLSTKIKQPSCALHQEDGEEEIQLMSKSPSMVLTTLRITSHLTSTISLRRRQEVDHQMAAEDQFLLKEAASQIILKSIAL